MEELKLESKKANVLAMLLMGQHTITHIAKSNSISRKTIYHWIKHDENFKDCKQRAEEELVSNFMPFVEEEMLEMLFNGNGYQKLSIIQQILKLSQKHQVDVTVNTPQTAEDLFREYGI